MSRIKMPAQSELLRLADIRSDIAVSVYLETSPMTQETEYCRIELKNFVSDAYRALEESGYDKRRVAALRAHLDEIVEDEDFCRFQSNTLALLTTPDSIRSYRLANRISNQMNISDRFYLKPLFRALTFRHTAYILALSENQARVIELQPESEPEELRLENMPKDASTALGLRSMTSSTRDLGDASESRKNRLARYARLVDEAGAPPTNSREYPLSRIHT